MRIPRSTVVMACITAIPFGLAIRGELVARRERAEAAAQLERERVEEAARRRAEADAEQAAELAHANHLAKLIGPARATPGPAFAVALDQRTTDEAIAHTQAELDKLELIGHTTFAVERGRDEQVLGIAVRLAYGECDAVRAKLVAQWGEPDGRYMWDVWIDPASHHRATLEDSECVLRFDDYIDAADWLTKIPTDLVGKKVEAVLHSLGPAQEMLDEGLAWTLPGIGQGARTTRLELSTADGKVTQITVTTNATKLDVDAAVDGLTTRLHAKPTPEVDETMVERAWTWDTKPPTAVSYDGQSLRIQVGGFE